MKQIYVIIDPLITDDSSWELQLAAMTHGYIESNGLDHEYSVESITDPALIKNYFQKKLISADDIFVFPNAWTLMTIYIKHWCENYRVPARMIGFWSRGCYINQDPEFRPMNDRNWRKVHERANFRCLDASYFISEFHKEQFRIYVSKNVFPDRLHVSQFPIDYLDMELPPLMDEYYKQDMIIFPWNKYSPFQEQVVYDFIRVFRDKKVIFAQENAPLERNQLLAQIAKSKIAFLPYVHPNIGVEIYECLLLNTIPVVPDIEGLRDLVPAEFRYPPEWTENIFNYSTYAPDLTTMVRDLIDNYESYSNLVTEQKLISSKKFYDSAAIMKIIFEN